MSRQRRRDRDPGDLSPWEAMERYLRRRAPDSTQSSLDGWRGRLRLFCQWCDGVGIGRVGDLRGYDLDDYYHVRAGDVAPVTLEGEMWTLTMFCRFLEDIEAVEDGLGERVRIPDLDAEDRSSDKKLAADAALALLRWYRESDQRASRGHTLLELLWLTGARQGGIRALDVRDVVLDESPRVEFRDRPDAGTGLKNGRDGERPVALPPETAAVVREYIDEERRDVRDDHGRQPLLPSRAGRPTGDCVRTWTYLATQPCLHGPCPHGRDRETCEYVERRHASKCPSTRAPHHIRTGAITWLLNLGWEPQDVADRVNATTRTIEQHYDKADPEQRWRRARDRMERRRRDLVDDLDDNLS